MAVDGVVNKGYQRVTMSAATKSWAVEVRTHSSDCAHTGTDEAAVFWLATAGLRLAPDIKQGLFCSP